MAGGGHEESMQPKMATHVMAWEVMNGCVGQADMEDAFGKVQLLSLTESIGECRPPDKRVGVVM